MLNKRIKSVLVAGLLVFSMAGGVFAETQTVQDTIKIENPKFEEGERQITLHDGAIILNLIENEDGSYYITTNWDSNVLKVISVKTFYENEYEVTSETQFKDGEDCATIIKGEDGWYKVNLSDMIKSKLVKVEVKYEAVKGNDPIIPPEEPEEPEENIYDPNTGDTSMMPIVVTAVASVAGLFVLNKKDDEE